jgi:hypothetical protein
MTETRKVFPVSVIVISGTIGSLTCRNNPD